MSGMQVQQMVDVGRERRELSLRERLTVATRPR